MGHRFGDLIEYERWDTGVSQCFFLFDFDSAWIQEPIRVPVRVMSTSIPLDLAYCTSSLFTLTKASAGCNLYK